MSKRLPKIAQLRRNRIIFEMRCKGRTYNQIGKALGLTEKCVWQIINNYVKRQERELDERSDRVRRFELERLDLMYRALQEKIIAGDPIAIEKGLKIMQQREKYIPGLGEPEKILLGEDPEAPFKFEEAQKECLQILKRLVPNKDNTKEE